MTEQPQTTSGQAPRTQPDTTRQAAARFERIAVRTAPGFASGGLQYDDLAPGVNIIFGPNGAGKTTTACTLHQLLWPSDIDCDAIAASGVLNISDDRWLVDVNFGRVHYQCNGEDRESNGPMLPSVESRRQYQLPLHDLLTERDEGFASQLQQAAAGGHDLPKAAEALGFTDRPSRPLSKRNALSAAERAVHNATRAQSDLKQKQDRLDELQDRLDEARAAEAEVGRIETALKLREVRAWLNEAAAEVDSFPEAMAEITGKELSQLETHRSRLAEYQQRIASARELAASASEAIAASKLPEQGVSHEMLESLRRQADDLRRMREQQRTLQQSMADADAQRTKLAAHAPLNIPQDMQARLREVDQPAIEQLGKAAQSLANAVSRQREVGHALQLHDHPVDAPAPEADEARKNALLDGCRTLTAALQQLARDEAAKQARKDVIDTYAAETGSAGPHDDAPPRTTDFTPNHLQSAIMVIAVAIILMLSIGRGVEYWLVALGLGVIAAFSFVWQRRTIREEKFRNQRAADAITKVDHLSSVRSQYQQLDLPQPEAWTIDAVTRLLGELSSQAVEADREVARVREIDRLLKQKAEADQQVENADRAWRDMLAGWNVQAEVSPGEHLWMVNQLSKWATADAAHAGLSKQLEVAVGQFEELLRAVNEKIVASGEQPATDAEEAFRITSELSKRERQRSEAQSQLQNAKQDESHFGKEVDRCETEIKELFETLSLPLDDDAALRDLIEQHENYHASVRKRNECAADVRVCEGRLHELAGEQFDQLIEADEISLRRQLDTAKATADAESKLRETFGGVTTQIEAARQSTALQDALAQKDKAAGALRDQREADVNSVVGQLLVDRLQQQMREHDQPQVFTKARQVLSSITRGRYELAFDAGSGSPSFRAIDTKTERGHELNELSSGTRVQLLLAVRLAFVEIQEPGLMLPLVLDETLANSDDDRATEIITAIIEVARTGRQVFYFTAQADEAGRWQHMLQRSAGDDWKLIYLLDCHDNNAGKATPVPITPVAPAEVVPPPEGRDRFDYARLLGVTAIDPREAPGSVHLWYLVRDVDLLYQLLGRFGIECWGQLRSLVENSSTKWVGAYEDWQRISARAAAIRAAIEGWRIGRGTPVNRRALLASDCVSETFIERVSELCDQLKGDAAALIAALADSQVAGFRSNKREELEAYFIEQGYVDTREPLPTDELRLHVMSAVGDQLIAQQLEADEIDELIGYVLAGEAQSSAAAGSSDAAE